jgi:hypothetical protein
MTAKEFALGNQDNAKLAAIPLEIEDAPKDVAQDGGPTLETVAKQLIAYRQKTGCSAEAIVRGALRIAHAQGHEDGYTAGYRAAVDMMLNGRTDTTDETAAQGAD